MKFPSDKTLSFPLPVKRDLSPAYILSLIIALLMAAVSSGGLLFSATLYPTDELLESYRVNDVINLLIGLPILLGSLCLTRHSKLTGLLCWPGALLYILYNYIAYLFGIPFGLINISYLALVLLSAYAIFDLLKNIDKRSVQEKLAGAVPVNISGWVLTLFGIAFFFRAASAIVNAGLNREMVSLSEIGLAIADMIISIVWVAGGFSLLRRFPLGYTSGLGLLFTASTLFAGLILLLFLRPILTAALPALVDIIVVLVMGLIFFIPFGLFLRGVRSKENM